MRRMIREDMTFFPLDFKTPSGLRPHLKRIGGARAIGKRQFKPDAEVRGVTG